MPFESVVRILVEGRRIGVTTISFSGGEPFAHPRFRDILEAALVDGARYWGRVRLIILPLIRRVALLTTLVSAIGSMLAFDPFYIMTSGDTG